MRAAIVFLLLSSSAFCQAPKAENKPSPALDIVVQATTGDVDFQLDPKSQWKPAQKGDKLVVGSRVVTGTSSGAQIAFGDTGVAVVQEVTTFKVTGFGVEGDKLVAHVFIDPGVVRVTVKQLPQYQTDFQVSTPRLTASVKGSEEMVRAEGDELPDSVRFVEGHIAEVKNLAGTVNHLSPGSNANATGKSSLDITQTAALASSTITGTTPTENSLTVLAVTSQTTASTSGDLTIQTTANLSATVSAGVPPSPTLTSGTILMTSVQSADIDSHTLVPQPNSNMPFEVTYFAKTAPDGSAQLLNDTVGVPEHEQTNLYRLNTGQYTFVVVNFSGSPTLGAAGTAVQLSLNPGFQQTFNADPRQASTFWTVFNLNVDASHHVQVVPVNTYSNVAPTGIHR